MQGIDNPSFLAIDRNNKYLYANSEVPEWYEGLVTAFAIDQTTGELSYLNNQSTLGNTASYNSVEKTNHYVLVSNYGDRHGLAMLPINADGSLDSASDAHEFTEAAVGTVPDRQDRSRVHCVVVDPSNTYVLANDLGLDKIWVYQLDLDSARLVPHEPPFIEVQAGGGPRHLVFHPSGKYAYATLELNSTVIALTFDSETGQLDIIQTVSALPEDFEGLSHCSDIHITPSGKYLYAGNRGHDSLVIYKIDADTGLLTLVGHQSTKGQTPRNFAIDPTGNYVLVGNQDSDTIVVFKINYDTGELIDTNIIVDCPTPVCLKFAVL